mmetsp:Transcript_3229/g.3570  ORF Transcript_3229/g.3570 Transcript_3229/m.3570 type:complete len:328 (+) Transcript_3229:112-1095(+)
MGDNDEQEDADLDAMNNDGDNLFEVIYLRGKLSNYYDDENPRPHAVQDYIIPNGPFRLIIDVSITRIDRHACRGLRMLTEVVFHNKVTEIGRQAFMYCSNLQPIELPAGLLRVEDDAFFNCTSLRGEIVIPASVQYMGDAVFNGCKSLRSAVFAPTSNVELGRFMFNGCSDLRFVTLPHNLRSIPAGFFYGCTSLAHLQIPVSVTVIGMNALCGSGLRSVTISENVHQIDREAFGNCFFLERVIIYSTNLNLRTNIFVDCPLLSTIMIAPWLWPKLFVSMTEHPNFIFKFFRQYQTQIFDFEIDNADVEVEVEVQGSHHNNIEDNNE